MEKYFGLFFHINSFSPPRFSLIVVFTGTKGIICLSRNFSSQLIIPFKDKRNKEKNIIFDFICSNQVNVIGIFAIDKTRLR